MTIKDCINQNGWQTECDVSMCRRMVVDVDFYNQNKLEEETQFDIAAYDVDELSALFADFCKENSFRKNTVISITIVEAV